MFPKPMKSESTQVGFGDRGENVKMRIELNISIVKVSLHIIGVKCAQFQALTEKQKQLGVLYVYNANAILLCMCVCLSLSRT